MAALEIDPLASDGDDNVEPPASKKARNVSPAKTLGALLEECGLRGFGIQKGGMSSDTEAKMYVRLRSMFPSMQRFSELVRIEEGVLSKASIIGISPLASLANLLEHWAAQARESFQCSEAKQTRHALWAGYTEKCEALAASFVAPAGPANPADPENPISAKVTHFNPCCTLVEHSEDRSYQLLVVRPTESSSLRFGVTMHVWRGGLHANTAQSSRKFIPEGFLPAEWTVKVHVILLMPHADALYFSSSGLMVSNSGVLILYQFQICSTFVRCLVLRLF